MTNLSISLAPDISVAPIYYCTRSWLERQPDWPTPFVRCPHIADVFPLCVIYFLLFHRRPDSTGVFPLCASVQWRPPVHSVCPISLALLSRSTPSAIVVSPSFKGTELHSGRETTCPSPFQWCPITVAPVPCIRANSERYRTYLVHFSYISVAPTFQSRQTFQLHTYSTGVLLLRAPVLLHFSGAQCALCVVSSFI